MSEDFQGSYSGIGEMLRADWMVAAMVKKAAPVLALAQATAPVYETGPHPGRYKAAFGVRSGILERKRPRAFAEVFNDAPEALFVEYGTKNNFAYHILLRALDAVD